MKIPWLCSLAMFCATAAVGQTSAAPSQTPSLSEALKTLSITGCVAGGFNGEPVSLTHAMVLPFGSAAALTDSPATSDTSASASPDPTRVSAGATQPQTSTPPLPAAPPTDAGAATTAPSPVGTSGTIAGTAPAGSSASSVAGYRLSGVDMTSWIGRRVQIVGTVQPARPMTQAVAVETSDRIAMAAMPQFRVLSVQPVTGACPK